jgi:hypothetical protein
MIELLIQRLNSLAKKNMENAMKFSFRYTFKALKMTDKRRRERILLFSSTDVIVALISLKSVCFPPNV